MGSVQILVPGPPPPVHRQVTIATVDGRLTYTVPLLSHIGIDSLASRWAVLDRPGRLPMTIWGGLAAVTGSITVRAGSDLSRSVEQDINYLRGFAQSEKPIIIACGQFLHWTATGTWIVTDLRMDDYQLQQGSNDAAQVAVTLSLTSAMTPDQILATGR